MRIRCATLKKTDQCFAFGRARFEFERHFAFFGDQEGFEGAAVYVEESGTSMAAPHVSGAVAAFLSVQREMIGRPDDVKQIFVSSAITLGRDPAFEGGGLVDLLRALESV